MRYQKNRQLHFAGVLMGILFIGLFNIPLKAQIFIQAEDYTTMQGVQTQVTTDEGGGINVGWIDNNDWMEYVVDIPMTGEYAITLRVASQSGGGSLNVLSGPTALSNISIGSTNGWQNWVSVESEAFELAQGYQTIKLLAASGGFNINWFELKLTNPPDTDSPDLPVILDSFADGHTIFFNWTESSDPTSVVTGYKIYNDNAFFGFTPDTSYSLTKLPPETAFSLEVFACDLAGNLSAPAELSISTTALNYELVWFDEFQGTEVDLTKWNYETGGHGWGNGEAQYYTNGANSSVADGVLTIEVRQETIGNNDYTSSRMNNAVKGDFLYGRIEVSAKLPSTGGTWPAIWTLPTDWIYGGWPDCGEIDIMEHTGNNLGHVFGTIHTGAYNHQDGTQKGAGIMLPSAVTTFHTYALEWYPDHLDWYYDDQIIFTFENEYETYAEWPFDVEHHLMLNVAVGGGLGGTINHNGPWPQQMQVDYVRIYDLALGAGDTIPPSAPPYLHAEVSGISVELSWTRSTDNQYVDKYYIFTDGELIDSTSTNTYQVTNLEVFTEYIFGVQAKDFGNNYSDIAYISATTSDIISISIPGKFEAEDYLYMEGMEAENCTDIGGGQNMAYIDEGDWLEYSIDIESAGTYYLASRTAAKSLAGSFQLLDENGGVLATVSTPVTGGWQNWKTVLSEGFYLEPGIQRITVLSLAKDFNLNWFGLSTDSTEYLASVNNNFADRFTMYPNPVVGNSLTLELSKNSSDLELCIYTLEGKQVLNRFYRHVSHQLTVDKLGLDPGIYMVRVSHNNAEFTSKLLVR